MTTRRPFGLTVGDPALEAWLIDRLRAVEDRLRDAVRSDDAMMAATARHLVDAGGKRFRPLVTLLASRFGDPNAPGVVPSAVVVELTHLATLYHDDVMDEAAVRRGAPSANARWTNTVAILTGDYLFAAASDILADLGPEPVRIQARTFQRLVTGQLKETVGPAPDEDPIEHHLAVLADKTGSLIATAARFGAMTSGCDAATTEALARFGERIGVAFQLSDDLIDIEADRRDSGKIPGTDLREGVLTLPVLLALRSDDHGSRRLRGLMDAGLDDDARLEDALDVLRRHDAMEVARITCEQWADDARSLLAGLPAGSARDALEQLCDAVVARRG